MQFVCSEKKPVCQRIETKANEATDYDASKYSKVGNYNYLDRQNVECEKGLLMGFQVLRILTVLEPWNFMP